MRSAAWLFSIACFLSIALAGGAASAPPQFPATLTVLVGKVQGPLNLRYDPTKSGPVSGDIFGDRIEGYLTFHSAGKHTLAFLQFKRNAGGAEVATNVYTADYDLAQANWMGASYALDVLGGASAAGNAAPFRTTGPFSANCRRDPACVARNNLPHRPMRAVQNPAAIDEAAARGFPVNVHRQAGSVLWRMVVGAAADGVLTGSILGDTLTGHYARRVGTIVFLRRRNGVPVQVFTGTLDLSAAAGAIKGGDVFPLVKNMGGNSAWRVVLNDQLVSGLRSLHARDRCLAPEDPASGPGGILTTTTACSNNVNVSWVVSVLRGGPGQTVFSLVSVATGLCLEMPGTGGMPVTQQVCSGAARQSLIINELQQSGALPDFTPLYSSFPINTTAAFGLSTNGMNLKESGPNGFGCLAVTSADAAVKADCEVNHSRLMVSVTNSRAGWTHNP